MASPATTGSSTSRPRAMIKEASETCCRSIPRLKIMPKVSARVVGMESMTSRAERHSRNPSRATTPTRARASKRASRNRSMFSRTWRGWSDVRAITRSSGRRASSSSSALCTLAPKSATCSPARMYTATVMEGDRSQLPSASRQV
jgi:hypothetical protein